MSERFAAGLAPPVPAARRGRSGSLTPTTRGAGRVSRATRLRSRYRLGNQRVSRETCALRRAFRHPPVHADGPLVDRRASPCTSLALCKRAPQPQHAAGRRPGRSPSPGHRPGNAGGTPIPPAAQRANRWPRKLGRLVEQRTPARPVPSASQCRLGRATMAAWKSPVQTPFRSRSRLPRLPARASSSRFALSCS